MAKTVKTADESPWLTEALSRLGQKEWPGRKNNNPKIMQTFIDAGHDLEKEKWITDETAWCAAGTCSCLKVKGYPIPPPSTNLMARSFVSYGKKCAPKRGAIGIWPRGKYPHGHVGFVTKVNKNGTVDLCGANQGNSWSIVRGKYRVDQALSFRWPVKPTIADLKKAGSSDINNAEGVQKGLAVGGAATGVTAGVAETLNVPAPPVTSPLIPADPAVMPVTPLAPDITLADAAEKSGLIHTLMQSLKAIGAMIGENPWIVGLAVGGCIIWYFARKGKLKRLERLLAGHPLSSETE